MDRSRLLKPAGVAVLSVLVGILASTGNEVVLVSLLVILTGVLVMWKQKQERNLKPEKTNKNSYSCEVEVKKVLRGRTTFEKCGKVLHHDDLGLCKKHAVEFLASIILKYSLDTKSLLEGNDIINFKKRSRNDGEQKEFDVATRKIEENELQLKASPSSWNNSDTQTSSLESSSEKTPILMEVVAEASSKTESNVQTQPEVTYPQVPSTSKENEEDAASAPEKACSDCKELPDNSYTSGYLEICKYFEEVEDDAVRDKKVRLACKLTDHGFDLDKVIDAAKNCDDFDTATRYLMQKCDSCAKFVSLPEIVQMFMCTHKFCKGCIKRHVATAMKERNILDCPCKVCEMPKLECVEEAVDYLSTLDQYLESILPGEMHEQFHRELISGTWKTRLKSKESKKSYADAKPNERDNCNQLQRSCLHNKTPGVAPFKLLCGDHSRCVDCLKEAISLENVLEFVCDVCYKGNREAQLEVMDNDTGFNWRLKEAVGPDFYTIFTSCLDRRIEQKECDSKFSSAISSRNSLNDYVEKRQTTCPNCRVHCDLTRHISKWIKCHRCKVSFCGICKAYYNNGCGISWCFRISFHLHHHEICYYTKDKFGIDRLKLILKANKVDFVDTQPVSGVCLLREVYHCPSKPFRSDLCRYHYEDYLANLILQNNLKTSSNWF